MAEWPPAKKAAAARLPEGPQSFEKFEPLEQSRWKLVPFSAQGGFDDWQALDQLFEAKLQGINPNRGIQGTVVEMRREILEARMREYFSTGSHAKLKAAHPLLYGSYAGYDAEKVRDGLRKSSNFDLDRIVPYVIFPLDLRWLYFETTGKLLNRPRPELYQNLQANEFLITVPEPRKESEARPILLSSAFDLHLHDRGSVGFPVEIVAEEPLAGPLFASQGSAPHRRANLVPGVFACLKQAFALKGDLSGKDARSLAHGVARVSMAICHAPQYQSEHKESLAQDWAHVPIPKSRELFDELVAAGETLATLLNPVASPLKALKSILGDEAKHLAVPGKTGAGNVSEADLLVEY